VAPEPIAYDGHAVTMSRIGGMPLRGLVRRTVHVAAMAEALAELHAAVPSDVLRAIRTSLAGRGRSGVRSDASSQPWAREEFSP
jgi:hypothetical protein